MYLSRFQNLFLNFSKGISTNFKMYLPKLQKVFVQISKCICPNFEMYLPNTVIPMIKRLVGLAGLLSSLSLLFGVLPGFSGPGLKAFATALAQGPRDQSSVWKRNRGAIEIAYLE